MADPLVDLGELLAEPPSEVLHAGDQAEEGDEMKDDWRVVQRRAGTGARTPC